MDHIAARKLEPKYVGHPFSKEKHEPMSPFTLDQYARTLKGFATWLREPLVTLMPEPPPNWPRLILTGMAVTSIDWFSALWCDTHGAG